MYINLSFNVCLQDELNMCLENPLPQEAERTSSSPFQFSSNMIPSCWAGVNNPLFTFDNNYHIQITIVMIFKTDSWMVINKYEKAKKVWEEYVEFEQEGLEMERVRKWMKTGEIERTNRTALYRGVKIEREEMKKKSEWLIDLVKDKDESNGQLINELAQNENCEANNENTLRNEDSFNSEDLDSSNDKTKTNDNSADTSQMDNDTCNNNKQQEESKKLDLELGIIEHKG